MAGGAALEAARVAQAAGAKISTDLRSMRLEDAVWAADAQVRGDNFPVTLTGGHSTFGRVVDTTLARDDRSVLHATIEVDL